MERLRADLETAQRELAQAEQVLGECMGDARDTTAATKQLEQAEDRVRALDVALSVARQKDAAACADLKQAETDAKREAVRALLVRLNATADMVSGKQRELGQLAAEAIGLMAEIRAFGQNELNSKLIDAVKWFRVCLIDSCEAMPECWTGLDTYKKRLPWSDHVPKPSEADRLIT